MYSELLLSLPTEELLMDRLDLGRSDGMRALGSLSLAEGSAFSKAKAEAGAGTGVGADAGEPRSNEAKPI